MEEATKKRIKIGYQIIISLLALVLLTYFLKSQNANLKLILGGSFLIVVGLVDLIFTKDRSFSSFFGIVSGIMAIFISYLPKNPTLFLFVFYSVVFLMFLGYFYFYRKMGNNFPKLFIEILYRVANLLILGVASIVVILAIKSIMLFNFTNLSLFDYVFIIQISIISMISLFLLIDNFMRLIVRPKISKILVGTIWKTHYSFFISLSFLLLIGGYYYVTGPQNPIFQQVLIVLGVAFFTAFSLSESLKSFLSDK
ncbi:Uncharacterised protein [uncultured archaeon]|nr:Uncharacterised protein [uncultured archaeon]